MSEHELWNELGNLYFMSGAYPQAVYAYNRSILLDREFGRPYSNLAQTYVQQGKYEAAIEFFRKSIPLLADDKEKSSSWSQLGIVYRYMKDYDKAVDAYQQADQLDPNNSASRDKPYQLLYGGSSWDESELDALRKQMDTEAARMDMVNFESDGWLPAMIETEPPVITQDEDDPTLGSGETNELEPEVDVRLVQISTDDSMVDKSEWLPLPESSGSEESLRYYELVSEDHLLDSLDTNLLQAEPEVFTPQIQNTWPPQRPVGTTPQAHFPFKVQIAQAERLPEFVVVNDAQDAKAAQTSPQQLPKLKADQSSFPDQREIEVGLARYKRVVQLNPKNAAAWDMLGNLYKADGAYKDAILAYQQAVNVEPSKSIYHHHLALVFAAERREQDAMQAYQKVIELEPNHGLAHAALGGYFKKMGLDDLAQQHIGKAMKIIYDSENEYNRACLLAISGNVDQALDLLRVALSNKQTYVDWVMKDPDLDFIRGDPRFSKLIEEYSR